MTIWFCGDVHGRTNKLNALALEHRPRALVLLGDIDLERPLEAELAPVLKSGHTDVWFIPGNHDTDTQLAYTCLLDSALAERNLHGVVRDVHGVRIAGLGGVFRETIWMPPAPARFDSYAAYCQHLIAKRPYRERERGPGAVQTTKERVHRSSIFPDDYTTLACTEGGAEVLVTHEAPQTHPLGFAALGELAQCLRARYHFHGHHHEDIVYSISDGVQTVSVGQRGIMQLRDGVITMVLPGET